MTDNRTEWIERHARNMLAVWTSLESPMRVDESYLAHLKLELEMCFDDPLRKALIEATYSCDETAGQDQQRACRAAG